MVIFYELVWDLEMKHNFNHSVPLSICFSFILFLFGCSKLSFIIDYEEITWHKTAYPRKDISKIMASPNGTIFAISEKEMAWDGPAYLFRSTDSGNSWKKLNWSMGVTDYAFNRNGDIFISSFSQATTPLVRSTDNGESWTELSINFPKYSHVRSLATNIQGDIFAGVINWHAVPDFFALFQSTDNGDTWIQMSLTPNSAEVLEIDSKGIVYAGMNNGIYYSTDNGITWKTTDFPDSVEIRSLVINPQEYFFAASPTKVYRAFDGRIGWTELKYFDSYGLVGVRSNNTGIISVIVNESHYSPSQEYGIFFSNDFGETWIKTDLPEMYISCFTFGTNGHMYVGTDDGLYKSDKLF